MKKTFSFTCLMLFIAACQNPNVKVESTTGDSATVAASTETTEDVTYPYTLAQSYKDWQPGNKKNTVAVLNMLKAWETKNFTECASYFGDSVELFFDYYQKVVKRDSLIQTLEHSWENYATVTLKMDDWESVISKDKKHEWVTVWYKQIWTDKKGKTDSIEVVNDAKMVDGKIVVFDEKTRHYPVAKK